MRRPAKRTMIAIGVLALWLAGLGVFLISCIVFLAYGLWFVATGRRREARALIGVVTAEEEAGSEIEDAKRMLEKERP